MTDWLPIEMGPTDGQRVLLYYPTLSQPVQIGYFRDTQHLSHGKVTFAVRKWAVAGGMMSMGGDPEPTHWMPLPDPPGGGG